MRRHVAMYQLALRLEHDLPFADISKRFPEVSIARWCNLEVDVLEAELPKGGNIDEFGRALKEEAEHLSATMVHVSRHSESAMEAVIRCRCAPSNSTAAIVESANCVPIMPVTYKGGSERVRLLAYTKGDQKAVLAKLGAVAKVTVEDRGVVEGHTARPAMTVSVDNLVGALTAKQLSALVQAIEAGYYTVPKRATIGELALRAGVPESTFEEHLRKAEAKVMRAMRPYTRISRAG